jgi:hypothetical protein
MPDRRQAILSAMKTFYPTYNVEPLLKHANILAMETFLAEDEIPEGVVFCKHPDATGGFSGGGLWATSKRLLYVGANQGWVSRRPMMIDYSYDKITSVEIITGALSDKITIHAAGNRTEYGDLDKKARVKEFIDLVRTKTSVSTGSPTTSPSQAIDLTAQLEKLSQLKSQGAITEEEYKAAKAKLLGL